MYNPDPMVSRPAVKYPPVASRDTKRSNRRPQREAPLMRKYAVACLTGNGMTANSEHLAPLSLGFDTAFSAVSHSSLIYSPSGPIQASDLLPGDEVSCASGDTRRVIWIGSMTGYPNAGTLGMPDFRLYRVSSDSFGLDCPMGDTLLGPGAYLNGSRFEHTAIEDTVDDDQIFEVFPQSPVRLYHVMLDKPDSLLVNGLAVESYVPDQEILETMSRNGRALFASLFSNLTADHFLAAK